MICNEPLCWIVHSIDSFFAKQYICWQPFRNTGKFPFVLRLVVIRKQKCCLYYRVTPLGPIFWKYWEISHYFKPIFGKCTILFNPYVNLPFRFKTLYYTQIKILSVLQSYPFRSDISEILGNSPYLLPLFGKFPILFNLYGKFPIRFKTLSYTQTQILSVLQSYSLRSEILGNFPFFLTPIWYTQNGCSSIFTNCVFMIVLPH